MSHKDTSRISFSSDAMVAIPKIELISNNTLFTA